MYKEMLLLCHPTVNWIQIQVTWYLASHWLVVNNHAILLCNILVWTYFMQEIFCCLLKHNGRSPVIVRRLSLHDEGIKQYVWKYVDQKWLSHHAGCREVSRCHTRGEFEWIHCIQATKYASIGIYPGLKPRADVHRNPKHGYEWYHKKEWRPLKKFLNISDLHTFCRFASETSGVNPASRYSTGTPTSSANSCSHWLSWKINK